MKNINTFLFLANPCLSAIRVFTAVGCYFHNNPRLHMAKYIFQIVVHKNWSSLLLLLCSQCYCSNNAANKTKKEDGPSSSLWGFFLECYIEHKYISNIEDKKKYAHLDVLKISFKRNIYGFKKKYSDTYISFKA